MREKKKDDDEDEEEGSRMYLNKFDRWRVINHDKESESLLSSNLNDTHQEER